MKEFNYEEWSEECQDKASRAVGKGILLNSQEIETIIKCLSEFDPSYYDKIWSRLRNYNMEAKANGFIKCSLEDHTIKTLVQAIEEYGTTKEDFEFLREMLRWYGVHRELVQRETLSIPDEREGYLNQEYYGTNSTEFVHGNIVIPVEKQSIYEISAY